MQCLVVVWRSYIHHDAGSHDGPMEVGRVDQLTDWYVSLPSTSFSLRILRLTFLTA